MSLFLPCEIKVTEKKSENVFAHTYYNFPKKKIEYFFHNFVERKNEICMGNLAKWQIWQTLQGLFIDMHKMCKSNLSLTTPYTI